MESVIKEMVGIVMVIFGVEIVAAQRVKQAAEEAAASERGNES